MHSETRQDQAVQLSFSFSPPDAPAMTANPDGEAGCYRRSPEGNAEFGNHAGAPARFGCGWSNDRTVSR